MRRIFAKNIKLPNNGKEDYMKKVLLKAITLCMALILSVGVLTGCPAPDDLQGVDTTKTQIYVANYEGGIGRAWLDDAKQRFEEY